MEWSVTNSRTKLRRFLGLANFCHKFIKKNSSIVKPLTDITSKKLKIYWSSECQDVFDTVKQYFISAHILIQPN